MMNKRKENMKEILKKGKSVVTKIQRKKIFRNLRMTRRKKTRKIKRK